MVSKARGECPSCRMPIPFSRTMIGRGKPFACRACGAKIQLLLNRKAAAGLAISSLALVKALGGWAVAPFLAALAALDWYLSPVELADANPSPQRANPELPPAA